MNTSKYWLMNSEGERLSLNADSGLLLKNVEGLGFTYKSTYFSDKRGFFQRTLSELSQTTIVGDILYMGEAFAKYKAISDWISSASDITLVYRPETIEYLRKINVRKLQKVQRNSFGWAEGTIELECVTPFYRIETVSGTSSEVSVTALGQMPSAMVLQLTGCNSIPTIDVGDYGTLTLLNALTTDQTLEWSTLPNDSHVTIDGENALTSVADVLALYPRIPAGETVSISTTDGALSLQIYHYFRSI